MRADESARIAIQAQKAALIKDPLQILGIRGVIAVVDLHPAQVHTFLFKDLDLATR